MVMRPALVNVMARAADKAARGLRRDFGEVEHLQISRKGPADFVSNADIQAQKIIRDELNKARPSFGFLMEEKDDNADTSGYSERWIVDPLDGTTNFLHGIPHWCISIAVERAGEIIAGYIHNPINDECFWAEKGLGAFQNSKRLRVSARSDMSECVIATGLPFKGSRNSLPRTLSELNSVTPQVAGIRRFGSAALDLAYVAAGRYDGYWEAALGAWDMAAGMVIVKEAGGMVSPLFLGTDPIATGSLIASNASIHDKLTALLRDASSENRG
ncbi:MAG: inositol monophosphatase family protein [Alphaproteobacteria bacterium]|nr:inositol monophosphatase family protein [Alphaproteobacteria bacterium]